MNEICKTCGGLGLLPLRLCNEEPFRTLCPSCMVGTAEPTEKQKQLAAIEADKHIEALKQQGE